MAEDLVICVPPANEQQQIVQHLSGETSKVDELILQSHKAMQLLEERRSVLITAAVTGKIDVRAFATSDAA